MARAPTIRRIELLLLCTANQCRSPMAEVLLRHHLQLAGVDADVVSAGFHRGGAPATRHGQEIVAARGLDLSGHRSRQVDDGMLRHATVVLGMTRAHVREAAVLAPPVLDRTFTLKEFVAVAERLGPRGVEPFDAWLPRLARLRSREALVGVGHDDALDIADPVGRGRAEYEATADLLDDLLGRVVAVAYGRAAVDEGQRA